MYFVNAKRKNIFLLLKGFQSQFTKFGTMTSKPKFGNCAKTRSCFSTWENVHLQVRLEVDISLPNFEIPPHAMWYTKSFLTLIARLPKIIQQTDVSIYQNTYTL